MSNDGRKETRQPVAPQDTVGALEARVRKLEAVVSNIHMENLETKVFNAAYHSSMLWWHEHYSNLPRKKEALKTAVSDSLTVALTAVQALKDFQKGQDTEGKKDTNE